MSTITPLPLGSRTGARPAAVSRSASIAAVPCSAPESSGCACRYRRTWVSDSPCLASHRSRWARVMSAAGGADNGTALTVLSPRSRLRGLPSRSPPRSPGSSPHASRSMGEPVPHLREQGVHHLGEVAVMGRGDRALPLAGRAHGEDPLHAGQLVGAVQAPGGRHQILDQVQNCVLHRNDSTPVICDYLCVEAVPRRAPFVLAEHPARRDRQSIAPVKLAIEPLHQRLGQRRYCGYLIERRQSVTYS